MLAQNKLARVPWHEVVMDLMEKSRGSGDFCWSRPDYNYLHAGVYLRHLYEDKLPPVVFVFDTSGSMPGEDVRQAVLQAQHVLDTFKPNELVVLCSDAQVCEVLRFEPGDEVKVEAKGGGGTDFRPAFQWVRDHCPDARAIVYITDMMGAFPEPASVDLPTVWVATSNTPAQHLKAPFGAVVQIQA